jgi:hypothetical protein
MAADSFYVGRVENESPTYRILTQDNQDMTGAFKGERFFKGGSDEFISGGSSWQIKSVSYADVIVKDDIYSERERLEASRKGPQNGDEIKVFQAARLASTTGRKQASKGAGKARGKPKGWTQDCGMSFIEFRKKNNATKLATVAGGEEADHGGSAAKASTSEEEEESDKEMPNLSSGSDSEEEAESSMTDSGSDQEDLPGGTPTAKEELQRTSRDERAQKRAQVHAIRQLRQIEQAAQVETKLGVRFSDGIKRTCARSHGMLEAMSATLNDWTTDRDEQERNSPHIYVTSSAEQESEVVETQATGERAELTEEERAAQRVAEGKKADELILREVQRAMPIVTSSGVTVTPAELLALPPIRNVCDGLTSDNWYGWYESTIKEQQSWIDTKTVEFIRRDEMPSSNGNWPHVVDVETITTVKPDGHGGVDKTKTRWPLNGAHMKEGVHFSGGVFTPTPASAEVKIWCAIAAVGVAQHGTPPGCMDISTAFLSTEVCQDRGAVYANVPGAWWIAERSLSEIMVMRQEMLKLKAENYQLYKKESGRWRRSYPDYVM